MPAQHEILANLTRIANEATPVAIAWHWLLAVAAAAFAFGVRPSRRAGALALSLPVASVGLVGWVWGNLFNGSVFALAAIVLAVLAWRSEPGRIALGPTWAVALGAALVAFGWTYPHFLETESGLVYFYSAAMGTLPCPTLSLVIGLSLLIDSPGSRAWRLVLAGIGTFYGLFGVLRLGVTIDVALTLGALCLAAQELARALRTHRVAQA